MNFPPMLAAPAGILPRGPGWRYEPKYDGVRCIAIVTSIRVELLTRTGNNLAKQFPEVVAALVGLRAACGCDVVLDGEIVATTSDGFAGFDTLQHRVSVEDTFRITLLAKRTPAAIVAFDLLVLADRPLLGTALLERRTALEALLEQRTGTHLRVGEQSADADAMLARSHAEGWEGLVGKQADSTYVPGGRGPAWVKYKVTLRQEFVIGGYTESDRRDFLRAVLVGYYAEGALVYAGDVGSGFSQRSLRETHHLLQPLVHSICPFARFPEIDATVRWVEPCLVAEVVWQEWTADQKLRFPRFHGIRRDKSACDVVRET